MSQATFKQIITLWVAVGVVAAALALDLYTRPLRSPPGSASTQLQSERMPDVFERVDRASTLRCGYIVMPPHCFKDTKTGRLSGIFVEVVEDLGRRLDLRIEWVEEVGIATMVEGLQRDRYDVVAFPIWENASRGRRADFTIPMFYSVVGAYVRADEHRFDAGMHLINSPEVTIATIDGELAASIAATDFPKAKTKGLPQMSDYTQLLLEISSRKADVTFFDRTYGGRFMAANPGKVRDISGKEPVRVYPNSFVIKKGEYRLKSMLDTAIGEMLNNGIIQGYFAKGAEDPANYAFAPPGPRGR